MVEKINSYKRLEGEVELKFKQISSLKLDASSVEAVSQLKGNSKCSTKSYYKFIKQCII